MWRSVPIIAVIFAANAAVVAGDVKPRTERREDGRPELVLPESLRAATRKYNPKMQLHEWRDYNEGVRKYFRTSHPKAVPWAVWGDFDGNGRTDVLLDMHDNEGRLVKAVVYHQRRDEAWRPHVLFQYEGYFGDDQFYILVRGRQYVEYWGCGVARGKYAWGRMWLQHDAIELVYLGSAAELYFWRNGKYQGVITD